jgi:hypothetical protein
VLHGNFLKPLESEEATAPTNRGQKENFYHAVDRFIQKALDKNKPQDLQNMYMAPSGDHILKKGLLTPPQAHSYCFKEMLRVAKLLPTRNMPIPNKCLVLEW